MGHSFTPVLTTGIPSRFYCLKTLAVILFMQCTEGRQLPPTFPLGAVVDLRLLAVLQVRMGQGVGVRGGSIQQFLGAAAAQAILTAVGGRDGLRRAPQTPTLSTEGTPGGAGSLTDSTAGDHRVVLAAMGRKRQVDLRVTAEATICICRCHGLQYACTKLPFLTLHRYFFWMKFSHCLWPCFFSPFLSSLLCHPPSFQLRSLSLCTHCPLGELCGM